MKKINLLLIALLINITAFSQVFTLTTTEQIKSTLHVGDKAPELKVKWIKGTPVNEFKDDMLYLVEFWATWCGPCKAAMPHLSELAHKYKDVVTFIGVNIWEKKIDPYDVLTPEIEEFVEMMGDKMDYIVAMDDNELHMSKKWMYAAGLSGIPASFLIKEGKVIWIGHPERVESIIKEVLDGTYNFNNPISAIEQKKKEQRDKMKQYEELRSKVDKALEIKDFTTALSIVDKGFKEMDKSLEGFLKMTQLQIYLTKDPIEALDLITKMSEEDPNIKQIAYHVIYPMKGLPPTVYDLAIDILNEKISKGGNISPTLLVQLAELQDLKGDKRKAKTTIKKAMKLAKKEFADGKISSAQMKTVEMAFDKIK